MNKATVVPFRRASHESVQCEPWQSTSQGVAGPLAPVLPHWDYNTDLRLVRRVVVREASLRFDCRLRPDAALIIRPVWHCPGTILRGRGVEVTLGVSEEPREFSLSIDISGQMLADRVRISTQVALAARLAKVTPLNPRFAGSILWSDEAEVLLEGTASRFATEVIDFSSAHWAPYQAGWYLSWNADSLDEPVQRNIRLFLNSAHPNVVAAVQSPAPTADHLMIRSAIYADVARQLIRGALSNEEFVDGDHVFDKGTTGRALRLLISLHFGGRTPASVRDQMISRPEYFDSLLQGATRLFRVD